MIVVGGVAGFAGGQVDWGGNDLHATLWHHAVAGLACCCRIQHNVRLRQRD